MDLQSRERWVEYSKAKDEMFRHTDIKQAPWYVVNADDKKRRARLNCIAHLLSLDSLRGPDARDDRPAAAPAGEGLRPTADRRADVHPGTVLRSRSWVRHARPRSLEAPWPQQAYHATPATVLGK